MRSARSWVALGSAGVALSAAIAAMGAPAATAAGANHHASTKSPSAHKPISQQSERAHPRGKVSANSRVSFDLTLALHHPNKLQKFVTKVSTPGSGHYRHYLSKAQFQHKFGPRKAEIKTAKSWLTKHGFKVDGLPATKLFVSAHGSAKQVEKAFSTSLGYYAVNGHTVRLTKSSGAVRVPNKIAGSVAGVVGVNQYVMTPSAVPNDPLPPPPAGFRNPQPCSAYWGEKTDTTDNPSLYAPYAPNRPYDICGYLPSQLRSAYDINNNVASGINGKGVTIGIVDAYDSPTILSDVQTYDTNNDPNYVLSASQFTDNSPSNPTETDECGSWAAEQALDIESSHGMAPGANIDYFGANSCFDSDLLAAEQQAVTHANVVSNSWGDEMGDLLEDSATKTAFDDTFLYAAAHGVSVLYSSGDDGDNFADFGLTVPNYPATSPYITAVGGTSLEIDSSGARKAELGWSTAKQVLCTGVPDTNCGSQTTPSGALAWQAGGGGGTSYNYLQPAYQAPVVPTSLSEKNEAIFGPTPLRVEPDVSMDADAQTGMLIGLTQTFPDGTYYDQFKEGGTSLASPLFAGLVADTDQAAHHQNLGFLNPALYAQYGVNNGAFNDILPPVNAKTAATIRVDYVNSVDATDGYTVSLRVLDYQGPETYCDATGNCATRPVTLNVNPGFDSLTGLGSPGNSFVRVFSGH